MVILVKGEHTEDIEFSVGEVSPPDVFEVTIGAPQRNKSGTVRYQLTIRIPPGKPRISRLGSQEELGKIILETNHPDTKQVPIYIRFALQ